MYFIYESLLKQLKQKEIAEYNHRHQDYINRTKNLGQKPAQTRKTTRKRQRQFKPQINNLSELNRDTQKDKKQNEINNFQQKNISNVIDNKYERPIKPKNNYQREDKKNAPLETFTSNKREESQKEQLKYNFQQQQNQSKSLKIQKNYIPEKNSAALKPKEVETKPVPIIDNKPINPLKNQFQSLGQQQTANIELFECTSGCGRKFAKKALEKHIKVCKKVFQQKRKQFVIKNDPQAQKAKKNAPPVKEQKPLKEGEAPKWLKQSQKFRLTIKRANGTITKQEQIQLKQLEVQNDPRIECPHCKRKFEKKTAEKHLVFCANKAKQKK